MKRMLFHSLVLFVMILVAMPAPGQRTQGGVEGFWQQFSAAVKRGDKAAVAALTRFPVEMSYGIRRIRNRGEFMRRYREVFNRQTDAPKCFETARVEMDASDAKRASVACPDASGEEVVIYHFVHTRTGWRFFALDNINE